MFHALPESGRRSRMAADRYALSILVHGTLLAGVLAVTRKPLAVEHKRDVEIHPLFVPRPISPVPSAARTESSRNTRVLPSPNSQLAIEVPELPATVPSVLPSVSDLIRSGRIDSPGNLSDLIGLGAPSSSNHDLLSAEAVDDPVAIIEQPRPRYPDALSAAGIPGQVELSYIVDTLGRAEPGSVRAVHSTHPAFETAARQSVLAGWFRPARLHGKVVRQLVRQTVTFRSGR